MKNILKLTVGIFILLMFSSCSKDDDETPVEAKQLPAKQVNISIYEADGSINTSQTINFTYENDRIKTMVLARSGSTETRNYTYDSEGRIIHIKKTKNGNESTMTMDYDGDNFKVASTSPHGSTVSEIVFDSTTKKYKIYDGGNLMTVVSYDEFGNMLEMDNTPFLNITKTINQQTKSIYYHQTKLFALFNTVESEDFFSGVIFGVNTIDKIVYKTSGNTITLNATNETSENGLTKVTLTNQADNILYLEALITY